MDKKNEQWWGEILKSKLLVLSEWKKKKKEKTRNCALWKGTS